jgi:regulatory protein
MDDQTKKQIRQSALNSLSRREHSELELSQKLTKKGYKQPEIKTILEVLTKEGLLSNQRFAENFIHYRQQKGYGPVRIKLELSARGIVEYMIEEHLKIADNAWLTAVRKVWHKRFKGVIPADARSRAKQMRFLQCRGFTQDQIETIFRSEIEHA